MMTTYDSEAEAAAAGELARLGCFRAIGHFPQAFTDADGTEFRAKPDFYHPRSDLFIEFKAAPLNGKKTKATADRAMASKQEFRGSLTLYDFLSNGWNHAKAKQAIVQRVMTPQNLIVVFEKPPTAKEATKYVKAGIVFIPLSALASYLGYVRLLKAGLQVDFLLRYRGDDGRETVLALGH